MILEDLLIGQCIQFEMFNYFTFCGGCFSPELAWFFLADMENGIKAKHPERFLTSKKHRHIVYY